MPHPLIEPPQTSEHSEPPPVTPHKNKYYRDHTNLSSDSSLRKVLIFLLCFETPLSLIVGHDL